MRRFLSFVPESYCRVLSDRSPAVVMAYLMKSRGWRLAQSYQWVKEKRQSVQLSEGMHVLLGKSASTF